VTIAEQRNTVAFLQRSTGGRAWPLARRSRPLQLVASGSSTRITSRHRLRRKKVIHSAVQRVTRGDEFTPFHLSDHSQQSKEQ